MHIRYCRPTSTIEASTIRTSTEHNNTTLCQLTYIDRDEKINFHSILIDYYSCMIILIYFVGVMLIKNIKDNSKSLVKSSLIFSSSQYTSRTCYRQKLNDVEPFLKVDGG